MPASAWATQLEALKARFPTVRDTILFCFYALTQDPEVDFETLKDQATERGLRITSASVNGARRLIANNEGTPPAKAAKGEGDDEAAPARVRRPRAPAAELDTEALIRGLASKLQLHGAAEANELREAMRRAIKILMDALGD